MVAELVGFVEVLVSGFENAEGGLVDLEIESHVGAVDEAVCVLRIKLCGETRDGSSLGIAGGDVRVKIRVAFEDFAEMREIVIEVGEVASYESCVAMTSDGALENLDHA